MLLTSVHGLTSEQVFTSAWCNDVSPLQKQKRQSPDVNAAFPLACELHLHGSFHGVKLCSVYAIKAILKRQ